MMDLAQLNKILKWNISVDPEIEIDKVLNALKGFSTRPDHLIKELMEMKSKGILTVDKYEMMKKLENL